MTSVLAVQVSILMIGMSGVGKSALINRLLGVNVASESAFGDADGNKIREYTGEYKGLGLKLIDTPGLEPSSSATAHNRSVLKKVGPSLLKAIATLLSRLWLTRPSS